MPVSPSFFPSPVPCVLVPQRSIEELKAAHLETPDPDYRAAIDEDIVALARKRAQVEALDAEIARAKGDRPAVVPEPIGVALEEGRAELGGSEPASAAGGSAYLGAVQASTDQQSGLYL